MKKMALALTLVAMFAVTTSAFGEIVTVTLTGTTAKAPDQEIFDLGANPPGWNFVDTPMIDTGAFNGLPGQSVELSFQVNSDLFPGGDFMFGSYMGVACSIDGTSLTIADQTGNFMMSAYAAGGGFSSGKIEDIGGLHVDLSMGISSTTAWAASAGILDAAGTYDATDFAGDFADQFQDADTMGVFGVPQNRTDVEWQSLTVTPEPATMALLGIGGILLLRRRR